jgi:cob(I)alamin adenosyltransferase
MLLKTTKCSSPKVSPGNYLNYFHLERIMENPRLVQIYWGNGKGKTTAALGAALRALGSNLSVHLIQFLKNPEEQSGELITLKAFPNFSYKILGTTDLIIGKPNKLQLDKFGKAFNNLKESLSKNYDLIIADEILYAVQFKLAEEEKVIELIKSKPETVELILTGSHVPLPRIFELADLITEMKKIKHPFDVGVKARKGFEY